MRLRSTTSRELARLVVSDPACRAALIELCPAFYDDASDHHSHGRIVFWSLAAVASIVATAVYGVPYIADRLAPLVPASIERRIGDMVDGQVRKIFNAEACDSEAGTKAFAKLMKAIEGAGHPSLPADAKVIRSGVQNAIALPGGKVYLFRGLLDKAQSADEIAGVLAHELGHVRNHDGMRVLIQNGGASFLLGLLFGDVSGSGALIFMSQQLVNSAYSRDAESGADGVAIETMNGIGRSPVPMGELLQRITGDERGSAAILASHPLTGDRLDRFKREWRPQRPPGAPILSDAEWTALKEICGPVGKGQDEKKG
jgi:predicted Zn-dependent protease